MTTGGDCPGLNAVIRSVQRTAFYKYGWEIIGIRKGILGLLMDPPLTVNLSPLKGASDHYLLQAGGTSLGSNRIGSPFNYLMPNGERKDRSDEFIENFKKLDCDGLIATGGDGGLTTLMKLCRQGNIPFVGIPKTIDNDIENTHAIGFSTAVDVSTEALDRLQPTASSHERVMVLEVMGRNAGHIGLQAGIAGGADIILIPEIPFNINIILEEIQRIQKEGRTHALIIVSEAARPLGEEAQTIQDYQGKKRFGGIGQYLASTIEQSLKIETRVTVLGHVQRGSQPNARDRLIATGYGSKAVNLLAEGNIGTMVSYQNGLFSAIPLEKALENYGKVKSDDMFINIARKMGICLGDIAENS